LKVLTQPLSGNIGPHLVSNPGLLLVSDPACFAWEYERWLSLKRNEHISIAVYYLKSGYVPDSTFEPSILVSADQDCIDVAGDHSFAEPIIPSSYFRRFRIHPFTSGFRSIYEIKERTRIIPRILDREKGKAAAITKVAKP